MMRTAKGGAAGRTGEEDTARRRLGRHLLPWVAPLGVLLMVLGLGCKGSSNSDTGNSVLPCTAISFTRSLASPGAGDVYLQAATSSCSSIDISVFVANLSGIFTVGFDLTYPSSVIAYQGFTAGPLLNQGSPATPPAFFVATSPGRLVVSGTLFRPDSSVSAVGSVSFISLHFVKAASGSGTLDFDTSSTSTVSEQIIDADGNLVSASFGPGHGGTLLVP